MPCLDSDSKSRLAVTGVPKLVSAVEQFGALAVEMQGEVPRAHTPPITLMRLSAQHLFSLSDKPEVSGFCPLEASLVIFFFFLLQIQRGWSGWGHHGGHCACRAVRVSLPRPGEGAGTPRSLGHTEGPSSRDPGPFSPCFFLGIWHPLVLWELCLRGCPSSLCG